MRLLNQYTSASSLDAASSQSENSILTNLIFELIAMLEGVVMSRITLTFPAPVSGRAGFALDDCAYESAPVQRTGTLTCWMLPCGHAMRLKASTAGSLRVSKGRIWLTFSHSAA